MENQAEDAVPDSRPAYSPDPFDGLQPAGRAPLPTVLIRDGVVRARIPWHSSSHAAFGDRMYGLASHAQWTEDDLDWSSARLPSAAAGIMTAADEKALTRSPFPSPDAWAAFRQAMHAWSMSQLVYGEQGALVVTGRLVETLPDMTSKCLAAVQVADEARHVRVMQRYLEATEQPFVQGIEMESLLGSLLEAPEWDYLFLGMQVVIEGLALSIFRSATTFFPDPLLSDICSRILRDEARHYSFGVVSLSQHLAALTEAERRDRQRYIEEAIRLMEQRFQFDTVWEQTGIPLAQGRRYAATDPDLILLRRVTFRPVVTALRRINLWDGLEPVFRGLNLLPG